MTRTKNYLRQDGPQSPVRRVGAIVVGPETAGACPADDPRCLVATIGAGGFVIEVEPGGALSLVAFNRRYADLVGVEDGPVLDTADADVQVLLTAEPFLAECRRCIETRGPVQQVEQVFLPKGPRWWQRTLIPLLGHEQHSRWILGIVVDVTEHVSARQLPQDELTKFHDLFEGTHVVMYLADPASLRLVGANRACLDFYGYSREEFLGKRLTDLNIAPEHEIRAMIARQANRDQRCFSVRHRLANGELRDLEIRAKPIIAGGQELYFAIVNDITERRRSEAALERAMRLADQANAAKTRFLAAASHDLRQPLQSAILFAELLACRLRDATQHDLLAKTRQALDSMNEMLSALLDVSRLDAGIVEATPQDFPIRPLMQRLAAEFEPLVQEIGLVLRCVPCSAAVRSDPHLLERIVRNLLSNALKYTERGGILLGCRRAGGTLRLQVWDTGIGISPDQVQTIFEEFYQIGNPARDRRKGLGLGLAIVRRLADLLGHPIRVRSVLGKGSMFEVVLPLSPQGQAPPGHEVRRARRARAGTAGTPKKGTGLVAVIEDDMLLLGGLRFYLEDAGYEVVAAITTEDAVAALRERNRVPDLVLADYRLADGKTGSEAVQRLRAAFDTALPGLLLTGDTSPDRLREAKDSGLYLLHKPVTPRILTEEIERILHGGRGRAG